MKTEPIAGNVGVLVRRTDEKTLLDLDRDVVVDLFTTSGAVLFRDFGAGVDDFGAFAGQFGGEWMTYRGGSYVRRKANRGDDATLLSTSHEFGRGTQDMFALPLHGEMYYLDQRPLVLWFYCVTPADSDGETTICDGSLIWAALSPSTRELLEAKRLRYTRRYADGDWQKIYDTDDVADVMRFCADNGIVVHHDLETGGLRTEYVHPAVIRSAWGGHRVYINNMLPVLWQESTGRDASIVRFEDGTTVPGDVVEELRDVQNRLMVPIPWQAQDLVMLDNTRFLHGRRAFTDPRREIVLRMTRDVSF